MSAQLSLVLPIREVRVPEAETQCGVLLRAFKRGERLTIWEAMFRYGIGALHQRVKDLRDMGWHIERAEVVKNGKRVAEFWMALDEERMAA